MSNVLVSLVSDQAIPNVLFIKEMEMKRKKDIRLYLFISTVLMGKKGKTEHIINGSHIEKTKTKIIEVIEDSIEDINSKLKEFAKEKLNDEDNFIVKDNFIVNLTGGTKIMSIGVYNFFKERKSTVYYLPIGKNIYKQIFPSVKQKEHAINFRIPLCDYLSSYGIKIEYKNIKTLKDKEFTKKFFSCFLGGKIAEEIISLKKKRNKKSVKLDEGTKSFLEEIDFETEQKGVLNKKEINYLTGGWFEEYVFSLIREYIQLDDDKIGLNVQLSHDGTQNEFDVMFVHENSVYVIECKTGLRDNERSLLNDTLYKLSALKKDFGLIVRSYLFTLDNNLRDGRGDVKKIYKNRADLLGVILVDRVVLSDKKELNKIFDKIKGGIKNV